MGLLDKQGDEKRCDCCGKAEYKCPDCPDRPDGYRFNHGWAKAYGDNPELAAIQVRNAKAARALAITSEHHPAYPGLVREYEEAGDELRAYRLKQLEAV